MCALKSTNIMMTENKKMTALINCPNDRMFSSEIETSEYRIVFISLGIGKIYLFFFNQETIFVYILILKEKPRILSWIPRA